VSVVHLHTCKEDITMNRVAPSAMLRQKIVNLDTYRPLTKSEQAIVLSALQKTNIGIDRILANLSRQTMKTILEEI